MDAVRHTDMDGYAYAFSYVDGNSHTYVHTDMDGYAYAFSYVDSNCHTYVYTDMDGYAYSDIRWSGE